MGPLQRLFEQTFGRVSGFHRGGLVKDAGLRPGEVAVLLPRPVPTYASTGGPPVDWTGLDVYLDGVRVDNVIAVDTSRGTAIRFKMDAEGRPVMKGEQIARELHRGNYSLRWRELE